MPAGIDYTDDEWLESNGHEPLYRLAPADRLLLHRHWMWANQQRELNEKLRSLLMLMLCVPEHQMS